MASRQPSVRHPNHSHPLSGHKALAEEGIICSGCDLDLIGAAYKCTKSECDYSLHKSCFDLPLETRHKAHRPDHPLTLLYSSPHESSRYGCNACAKYRTAFVYNCSICECYFHVGCISLPESMEREEHEHPLTLRYCSPYRKSSIFQCHICQNSIPEHLWSYYCKECDYGTHLHPCKVVEKVEPQRGGGGKGSTSEGMGWTALEVAEMLKAQMEMERIQMERMQMERVQMERMQMEWMQMERIQKEIDEMRERARKLCLKNI